MRNLWDWNKKDQKLMQQHVTVTYLKFIKIYKKNPQ